MRIFLDPQIFNDQKYGGISRYYTEIFSRLIKKADLKIVLPLYQSENVYVNESNLISKKYKNQIKFYKLLEKFGISSRKRTKMQNEKILNFKFSNQNFDIFIPTYYKNYFIDLINDKPFVLTVYDMIHELFPQYFLKDSYSIVNNKLELLEKATRIIAVSENTKKDIIRIYPHIDISKIDVVYHGNSIKIFNNINVDLPKNYILFVGSRPHYKNFYFLIESITEILKNDKNLLLLCAGGDSFNIEEISYISNLGLETQIIQRNFKENELGLYYKNAKCFVFPSMYEGFGIPVLEAMACGCPIVLTNHSSFPEVAGNAGVYFELNNLIDLRTKIIDLIYDNNKRKIFIDLGYEQVKKFDWDNAANQCLEVYKKAVFN